MSGSSLNYVYKRVADAADSIQHWYGVTTPATHVAFARHLRKVAKALRDVEWVLSNDKSPGDELPAIAAVLAEAPKAPAAAPAAGRVRVGQLIQHCSSTGAVFEVIQHRSEFGDFLAVSLESDPRVVRVINEDNWRVVHPYRSAPPPVDPWP